MTPLCSMHSSRLSIDADIQILHIGYRVSITAHSVLFAEAWSYIAEMW